MQRPRVSRMFPACANVLIGRTRKHPGSASGRVIRGWRSRITRRFGAASSGLRQRATAARPTTRRTTMIDGSAVKRAREAAHLTQAGLAKAAGMAAQTVSAIEQGRLKWTKFLPQLARVLNLTLGELDPDWAAFDAPRRAVMPASRDPQARQRLDADYPRFAGEILRIRTKGGAIKALIFNRAQRHVHAALEAQRENLGRVRALILKGRQQGCSTYIGGRYYHRASRGRGLIAFILTHEQRATHNLFEMVERFHANCPAADKPVTGAANAEELAFSALDSGFKVGTAGTKGVGRSATIQLFHGSEVAFWPFAETHAAGALQAVPNEPGTEVILEAPPTASAISFIGNGARRRRERANTSRSSCRGSGRTNTGSRPAARSGSTRRRANMPRSTASSPTRWRGGA